MRSNAGELFKQACRNGTVKNEIIIYIPVEGSENPHQIRNDEIVSDSMKLTQSICDDSDLRFGGCIASEFEIETTANIGDLTGRRIYVYLSQTAIMPTYPGEETYPTADGNEIIATYPGHTVYKGYGGNSIRVFTGYIFSCKLSKKRIIRKIVAYDDMYWKGNADCAAWYRSLYTNAQEQGETVTMNYLRTRIAAAMRLADTETLPTDDLIAYEMDISNGTTYIELLRQICELNGCFAFINGSGQLEYRTIKSSNYVDGVNNIFESYDHYKDVETEDFVKLQNQYNCLEINGDSGFKGITDIEPHEALEENPYVLSNDIYTTHRTPSNDLSSDFGVPTDTNSISYKIGQNIAAAKPYTPIILNADYRSWVEAGDRIRIPVYTIDANGTRNREYIWSLVLSRTISGLPYLADEIVANGEKNQYTD